MKKFFGLLISLFIIFTAFFWLGADTEPIAPGDIYSSGERTITAGNSIREYYLHLPEGFSLNNSYPLMLVFHGSDGNRNGIMVKTNFKEIADREKFIIVYPESLGNIFTKRWNFFGGESGDVNFIKNLINEISRLYPINTKRIYAVGMSNGGSFAQAVGCLVPEIDGIAAVSGSIAGSNLANYCERTTPISFVGFYGTSDKELDKFEDSVSFWAGHNNCQTAPSTKLLLDSDPSDGTAVEKVEYRACNQPTVYFRILNGGHLWPGGTYTEKQIRGKGNINRDISASEEIWSFFKSI